MWRVADFARTGSTFLEGEEVADFESFGLDRVSH